MRFLYFSVLLLGLSHVVAPLASAQTSFGVRAGINVATISGEGTEELSALTGILFGGFANLPLGGGLSLQPEVLFSQKGVQIRETLDDEWDDDWDDDWWFGDVTVTYALTYIDIPVLLKYTFPTSGALVASLHAGPQVSFKIDEKFRFLGISLDTEEARSVDVGLVLGGDVGARLAGGNRQVGVGVRYALGLTDIGEEFSHRNRVLSISAFFGF